MADKYYTTKACVIDGKHYQKGAIVWTSKPRAYLLRAGKQNKEVSPNREQLPLSHHIVGIEAEPIISVIVTFHNQLNFADRVLTAFARQDIDVPYEIIAIDDASDATDSIESLMGTLPFPVIYQKVNFKNACKARNAGVAMARGVYVAFFDGDDYPFGSYLRKLYRVLERDFTKDFSYARYEHEQYEGRIASRNCFEWSPSWVRNGVPVTNTPIMTYRNFFKDGLLAWNETLECMQDADLCYQLESKDMRGVHVPEVLWHYEYHSGSLWGSGEAGKKRRETEKFLRSKYSVNLLTADITLISMISRMDVLQEYFDSIRTSGLPFDKTHWFVFVDSTDQAMLECVRREVEYVAMQNGFLSSRIYFTNQESLVESTEFEERANRITKNMQLILEHIGRFPTKYVAMLEDDTIVKPGAFDILYRGIYNDEKIGMLTGVEVSRYGLSQLGISFLVETNGQITERILPLPKQSGVEEIDGCGWYCWIARLEALQSIKEWRCLPDRKIGPDIYTSYQLKKNGWKLLVDWSVWCGHWHPEEQKFLFPDIAKAYHFKYTLVKGKYKKHKI